MKGRRTEARRWGHVREVGRDGSLGGWSARRQHGEIRGVRKRVLAASVIGAAVLAGVVSALLVGRGGGFVETALPLDDMTRRQVIGDTAIIEKGIKGVGGDRIPRGMR